MPVDADVDVNLDVRELRAEDAPAAWELGRLAFGAERRDPPPEMLRPGATYYGAYDETGRLVGKASDRHYRQAYGGRWLPAAGVADVAVSPEARGRGVGRALLTSLLRGARDRGAAVSPLYPTVPAVYRALGWEVVGSYAAYRIPTLALAGLRVPAEVSVRLAEPADVAAVKAVYAEVAVGTDGMLDRSGPLCADGAALLADLDGLTLALGPEGSVEGYLSWERGAGYDAGGQVRVHDLLAVTLRARTALLAVLGSWAPVAPTLVLRLLDEDALAFPVPVSAVERQERWMLRVVDAGRAVAQRGWPAGVRAAVDLDLADPLVPEHAGPHRLVVEEGEGRWEPGGAGPGGGRLGGGGGRGTGSSNGSVRLHVRALAALLGGGTTTSALRRHGLLDGDPEAATVLDLLCARPRPQLLDYF